MLVDAHLESPGLLNRAGHQQTNVAELFVAGYISTHLEQKLSAAVTAELGPNMRIEITVAG